MEEVKRGPGRPPLAVVTKDNRREVVFLRLYIAQQIKKFSAPKESFGAVDGLKMYENDKKTAVEVEMPDGTLRCFPLPIIQHYDVKQ